MNMPSLSVQENRILSDLCTFGIGGPARYLLQVNNIAQMQRALVMCRTEDLPYIILGKGSNCLFDDRGFNGMVILNKIDFFHTPSPGVFHVGAGYSFSLLGIQTARQGWGGLEFASGIPATVGGAVFMNAGANGTETSDALVSVDYLTEEGILTTLRREELHFGYRSSPFQQMCGAIVGAVFRLKPDPDARKKQIAIVNYRKSTQPYKEKSAGCVFRNPACAHAGLLIDQNGLKGTCIGGAKVSNMHANFIVNTGGASALDVFSLISLIKKSIKEKTSVELEIEIRPIPYEVEEEHE
jgi:UDP-N-acetylmuramate dehydrogenase